MTNKQPLLQRLADAMDLPEEPLPGVPVLELLGDRRILIDSHHGVAQYSGEKILVNVAYGQLEISGENLELLRMTSRQLIVSGTPVSIALLRRASE